MRRITVESTDTGRRILGTKTEAEAIRDSLPMRTFVNVKEPNTTYQIVEDMADERNKPMMTMEGAIHRTERVGDKFVVFIDGVFSTNDPECIAWCKDRYPDILDIDDPAAAMLVPITRMQVPRSDYEPEVSSSNLLNIVSKDLDSVINSRASELANTMADEKLQERLKEELAKRGVE